MKYLALDVGLRHTGVALADDTVGIPLPQETVHHDSFDALFLHVLEMRTQFPFDVVVLGLPLLPSGDTGEQAELVQGFADMLDEAGIPVSWVDERHTSKKHGPDDHASAACAILDVFLERNRPA